MLNVCPKNVFYRTIRDIRAGMIVIGIITLFLGLMVSEYFTKMIYSPIKGMVDRIGGMKDGEIDEYGVINAAVSDMSCQISDLQRAIDTAKEVARRELVISLCLNKGINSAEFKKLVEMCQFSTSKKVYVAVVFKIDKDIIENLTAESVAKIIKSGIETIESMSCEGAEYIAGNYEKNKILVVAGFSYANDDIILSGIRKINEVMLNGHDLNFVSIVGMPVKKYEDVYISFECAKNAEKYAVFTSQRSIIYASEVLKRDNSSLMINDRIMDKLRRDINNFDMQMIKDHVGLIVDELMGKNYSASYCNRILLETVNIISEFLRNNGMSSLDIMDNDLITIFNGMDNICEYKEWIYEVIEKIAEKMNAKNDTNNSQMIEKVKAYINDNLSSALSLTSVSEKVYISSQYLCKIFKEETNMNFVDYVTLVRMERAKELLNDTNMTIESISEHVGYQTPHYFTKKFKERFGMTPKNFRMSE